MKKNAIVIEDLSFSYDEIPILKDVNLKIHHGNFIGVVGPNGGGKTTLLKLMLGLLKPKKGSIKVFEKHPKEVKSKIGYVPQSIRIDKNFPISLMELVLLGGISKASILGRFPSKLIDKAEQLLHYMDLCSLKDRPVGYLSGGEMQRALIARALICDPKILILDEPTANIDIATEHKILDLLSENQNEMTIIMVSHDLEVIVKHVKTILIVEKTVTESLPDKICEHFTLGLYHKPYLKK